MITFSQSYLYSLNRTVVADFIDNMVFDFAYHEHLSYFSIRPVEKFLARHGLTLVDVVPSDSKGGSLRYLVRRQAAARAPSARLDRMRQIEVEKKIQQPEGFSTFMNRIATLRAQNLLLLRNLRASGRRLAGYGASATTTTLFYHFGLDGLFDFLVDENAVKIGRFSPGLHIPVFSPEAIYREKPEYVFVAAWRFADLIMKKHANYTGSWIIPLPELRVIPV